jgi:hypothetical protein
VVDGVSALPLIRSLIDCLYNVTAILEDPAQKGPAYRKSGLKRTLGDLNEDAKKYGGQAEWDFYIEQRRKVLDLLIQMSGLTIDEVTNQRMWPTLGAYIAAPTPRAALTDNQAFLKTFTHLNWRQYSAMSHAAYEAFIGTLGHIPVGSYYLSDLLPHEMRPKIEESYNRLVSTHIGRAATVLLCLITELQAHCHFEGANINERIVNVWNALLPMFEATELYDGRYRQLMEDRCILPSGKS